MAAPTWVKSSVFYQIFPDRFARGNARLSPPNVQAWGAPPTPRGFQGGDLEGIVQHLDYLLDLGVNAIYLNPVFLAPSNHRYNTIDYYMIDPKLGDLASFRKLLALAHERGIRVVLDGVFNHCGRGFFAFVDVLENEVESPYKGWFHISRFPVEAYGPGEAKTYQAWWNFKSLPKLNVSNPAVRQYLLGVAKYWIQQGADGWRLDVPNEIADMTFWAELRETVKQANPEAYLVGEIWEVGAQWVGERAFDGLMNYPFRSAVLDFLREKSLSAGELARRLTGILAAYPRENAWAHYLPLGSHDTPRLRTLLGRDARIERLAFLLQFFYPGAPALYYGDELGLEGEKDPDNRRAFPWDREKWDRDLWEFVRGLIRMRRSSRLLQEGEFVSLWSNDAARSLALGRRWGEEACTLLLNASDADCQCSVPVDGLGWKAGERVHDVLSGVTVSARAGMLEPVLPPRSAMLLFPA